MRCSSTRNDAASRLSTFVAMERQIPVHSLDGWQQARRWECDADICAMTSTFTRAEPEDWQHTPDGRHLCPTHRGGRESD